MEKLSVTIITYNEEKNIRDCLNSVKWADEIVVVDSFSTDKTVEICREYTDKVYQNKWHGFVEQKNFALSKASHNWILSIDADERISGELGEEVRRILKDDTAYNGYYMPRKAFYVSNWILHCGWYPDYKIRLFRKDKGGWEGAGGTPIHESVKVEGRVGYLKGDLLHYSFRDISSHLKTINTYTSISENENFKRGKRGGISMLLRPPVNFIKMYIIKGGFLDGLPGFIVSALSSFHVFLKYAKMWEMKKERQNKTQIFTDTRTRIITQRHKASKNKEY
ncbi:MAG: glycosyltransferase family 2 protein [Nitrospinae bacterium]|nr:glycosyltransferase family 2 protein [Nitrospinota bacterium]